MLDAVGNFDQYAVSCLMAKGAVYILEVVESKKSEGNFVAGIRGLGEGFCKTALEVPSIGEARQAVPVSRLMLST